MYSLTKDLKNPKFPIGIFTVYNFLTDKEIDTIFNSANELQLSNGVTFKDIDQPSYLQYGNQQKLDEDLSVRNSKIGWIFPINSNLTLKKLFEKIYCKIIEVNQNQFGFNLTDIEPFQFTTYSKGEYYKKHLDLNEKMEVGNTQRKLSFSIQLSDEKDYDGGDLCCYAGETPIVANKQKGSISFFPSFMLHEVKEVTRGKRCSLVGWAHGPRFV